MSFYADLLSTTVYNLDIGVQLEIYCNSKIQMEIHNDWNHKLATRWYSFEFWFKSFNGFVNKAVISLKVEIMCDNIK